MLAFPSLQLADTLSRDVFSILAGTLDTSNLLAKDSGPCLTERLPVPDCKWVPSLTNSSQQMQIRGETVPQLQSIWETSKLEFEAVVE